MKVLLAGRAEGKTTAALEWVRGGAGVYKYPFWSRVLIVPNIHEVMRLKDSGAWVEIEDFDHRVYSFKEFYQNPNFRSERTEYRIDNLDMVLRSFFNGHMITGFTITGEVW